MNKYSVSVEEVQDIVEEWEDKYKKLEEKYNYLKDDYDDFKENLINEFENMKCEEYDERDEYYNLGIDACISAIEEIFENCEVTEDE